jgi:hypothetical protein
MCVSRPVSKMIEEIARLSIRKGDTSVATKRTTTTIASTTSQKSKRQKKKNSPYIDDEAIAAFI